jgi:hypothetical protein
MPADEHLGVQFSHEEHDWSVHGESRPLHRISAFVEYPWEGVDKVTRVEVGSMLWNARGIRSIDVMPERKRQGIATGMWNEGHRLASEVQRIPKPTHSSIRTAQGDKWARAVGGRLPRRQQ